MRLLSLAMLVGVFVLPSWYPTPAQAIQESEQPTIQNSPADPLVNKKQNKSDKRPDKEEGNKGYFSKAFYFVREYNAEIVTLSTVIMALFTCALAISTQRLWKSGERHSERELRAYVSVTEINTTGFRPLSSPETAITIKNSGKTPAYDFKIERTFDLHKIPRNEFHPYPSESPDRSSGSIGPGVEISAGGCSRRPFTAEEYKAVICGEIALFFFGRIDYTDAFKKNRFTNFRYIGKASRRGITWDVAENGNDSD